MEASKPGSFPLLKQYGMEGLPINYLTLVAFLALSELSRDPLRGTTTFWKGQPWKLNKKKTCFFSLYRKQPSVNEKRILKGIFRARKFSPQKLSFDQLKSRISATIPNVRTIVINCISPRVTAKFFRNLHKDFEISTTVLVYFFNLRY